MKTVKSPIDTEQKEQVTTLIRQLIPAHQVWCEPYFHSGEVFFNKRPSPKEIVNDRNDNIVNFYMMVRDRWQQLSFLMESTLHCDFFVKLAEKIHENPEADELHRAWAFWLKCHKAFITPERWEVNDVLPSSSELTEERQKAIMRTMAGRLKNVFISNRQPISVIQDADGEDTAFFINPPDKKELLILMPVLRQLKGKFILYTSEAGLMKKAMQQGGIYTTDEWRMLGLYTNFKRQLSLFEE